MKYIKNLLHIFSFNLPIKWADLSKKATLHCVFSIRNALKSIWKKDISKPVGRWRIEECNIKMNQKIDLSNEDHCGPCGQYALEKQTTLGKIKIKTNKNYNSDVYLEKQK
jgi:hypothetical protein